VATVSVSPATASVQVGATVQLSATTRDASGATLTGRVVAWSSATPSVASGNSNGRVSAVAAGTAQITASSEGRTSTAAITVTAPPPPPPAPAPVATVSVSPATSSLLIGATVQLAATTRDASGNALTGRAVAWSSANSSIASVNSSSGLVTAVAAGTVQITATSEGKTGNATIAVSAPAPAPVATVSVSPATSSAIIGNTVSLSATTRDASGNVLTGRAIAWSSGNTAIATVNSTTGVVRAVAVGTVQVTATSEGKTGTASFTSQPLPPPPPPGTSNEPSGMTQIADRSFNALQEGSWYTDTRLSIVQDPTAPKSPNGVLRANFPSGFAGGTSDGPAELAFSSYKTLYISYWAKYSSNWQGHNTGINKHCYVWLTDAGGYTPFVMEAEGSGSGTLRPRPILQRMIKGDGPYAPNLVPGATIQRGQWFRIEIVIVGNSANTADGTMDIYLDGAHVTSVTGLQWSNGAARWNIFQFYPVWGGIGDRVNSTMTFDWDNVYLSGK